MPTIEGRLHIEYIDPNILRPFDGNPRKISDKGLEKLQRSVEEFGFINPIIAQRGTRMVIAGHQRLKAAKAAGLVEVPVVWLDVDDVTARAYNIADNRTAEEAEWDFEALAELLAELENGAFDLNLTGFADEEIDRLLNSVQEPEMENSEEPNFTRERLHVIIVIDSENEAASIGEWAEEQGYEWHVQVVPIE